MCHDEEDEGTGKRMDSSIVGAAPSSCGKVQGEPRGAPHPGTCRQTGSLQAFLIAFAKARGLLSWSRMGVVCVRGRVIDFPSMQGEVAGYEWIESRAAF